MELRKSLDLQAGGIMTALTMIWGLQQIFLKMVAADIAPILQLAIRSGCSALLIILLFRHQALSGFFQKALFKAGCKVAVLFSLEFLLVAESLHYTYASHSIVLLYTAPIFVALALHFQLPSERLNRMQWLGIGITFLGLLVAFLWNDRSSSQDIGRVLWGDALALGAGIALGATTVTVRLSVLSEAPATQTLSYQLIGSFIILSLFALLTGQTLIHFTPLVLTSLTFQIVVVSFASFLVWFWLLKQYVASGLGIFSFLTPIFGVLFSVILLHEQVELNFIVGAVFVFLGIVVMNFFSRRSRT